MTLADAFALGMALFSLVVFLQLGFAAARRVRNSQDFLLAGRHVKGLYFQHTLAASGTSLATVLFFFLTAGHLYGIVFLINLATFLAGQFLFFRLADRAQVDLQDFTTLSGFVTSHTGSTGLGRIVRWISVTSFLGVLFIELFIGTTIFEYFVSLPHATLLGFLSISILMIGYIALGGFAAVIENDSWQFRLMFVGTALMLIFLLLFYRPESFDLARAVRSTASTAAVLTLILNATLVNLTLPLCQVSSWQRLASVANWEEVRENFMAGLWKILFIWGSFIIFALALNGGGVTFTSVPDLFALLVSAGGVSALFIYPLVFAGLISALISTADSAAMAVILEGGSGGFSRRIAGLPWKLQRRRFAAMALGIFLLLGLGFALFQSALRPRLIHLIFVLFSQTVVMFPLLLGILRGRWRTATASQVRVLVASVVGSFVAVWIVGVLGMVWEDLAWTQFASAVGLTIAFLGARAARSSR